MTGYDRAVLVEVLVYHYRDGFKGCGCGWSELGRSWPEHVAIVYEESLKTRLPTSTDAAEIIQPLSVPTLRKVANELRQLAAAPIPARRWVPAEVISDGMRLAACVIDAVCNQAAMPGAEGDAS